MHFYLPRRHRRPLLFPPGLLALAGLLWLGCVVLGPWQERLKPRTMLRLTMLVLPRPDHPDFSPYSLPYLAAKVRAMGPWRNTYITGKPENVAREHASITNDVRTIMADSAHQGRVRVRFTQTARYKDLIFVLDLMVRENVRRYWFDIVHKPITFYALTEIHERRRPANFDFNSVTWYSDGKTHHGSIVGCIRTEDVIPSMPPSIPFWRFAWLRPLLQPEWRVSAWFLAAIVMLGGWRLVGPRRATQAP
ncbi:hypothetical protein [Hymenobacter sp. PAMC 26628]|uniref:hypothetical protein n=1 Tax=Hymenobacter sp. PAMC 26628 TaxID=1484118 RepID=UPI000AA1FB9A|nr:hypothetical protein [Hymenobacter sp. PAMC 26628]